MKKPIIGFCGYAQVGKDTAAQALVKQGWTRIAFADQVKEDLAPFVKEHFGWDIFNLDPEQKDIIRPIMVEYACSKRKIDPDYWIKRLWEKYIDAIEPEMGWVISDVRYMNELKAIHKTRGIVFGIIRQGYGPANEQEQQYTTALLQYLGVCYQLDNKLVSPLIIINNSTIEDLHNKVFRRVWMMKMAGLLPRVKKDE